MAVKKIVQAVKDKVAYEKESWRMSQDEMSEIRKEHPEMFRQKKGGKR